MKTYRINDRWTLRVEHRGYDPFQQRHNFGVWFNVGGLPLVTMDVGGAVCRPDMEPDFRGAAHAAISFGLAEAEVGRNGRDRDENRPANNRELAFYEEGFSDAVSGNAEGTGHHFEEVVDG